MFRKRQKNNLSMNHNHTEKPVNYLYPFTVSYGYDTVSGLSVEPLDDRKDIARQITRTFFWDGMRVPENFQKYWRHAFIYHHDLPSSVSLPTIRERCYQHHVELRAFVDAVREYKRAILRQENVSDTLDALKEAKKSLLLVVV